MTSKQAETGPKCSKKNVGRGERIASGIAGALLVGNALFNRKESLSGTSRILSLLSGAALVGRGMSGKCAGYSILGISTAAKEDHSGINIYKSVTVNRPVNDLYGYWRNLKNASNFMSHIKSVDVFDDKTSEWTAVGPFGFTTNWKAHITAEERNEYIAWESLPGAEISNIGSVRFMPNKRGETEVILHLRYNPPAGKAGAFLASLLGEDPSTQIENDLRRFKQLMEVGEIATTKGQPQGKRSRLSATDIIEKGTEL